MKNDSQKPSVQRPAAEVIAERLGVSIKDAQIYAAAFDMLSGLEAAEAALNQIPNTRLNSDRWKNSYAVASHLGKIVRAATEERQKIETVGLTSDELRAGDAYFCILRSVGNPDMQQYYGENVLSPTMRVTGPTPQALIARATAYRDQNELGGGNWPTCKICDKNGEAVGQIAYNGRLLSASGEVVRPITNVNTAPLPAANSSHGKVAKH